MTLLKTVDLCKHFGGVAAVDKVSLSVQPGEIMGLVGPNGSGKTTVLNMLSGFLRPASGEVWLADENVTTFTTVQLAQRGLLRMFQMTRVFTRISCLDNLLVAGMAMGLAEAESTRRAAALLEELTLSHVQYLDAGSLSGGQRKLLEFGMCFMQPPRIALLDEPFAAVHPVMRETMADFIRRRHAQGQTFVLVSHDMPIIIDLCQRAVCMNLGRVIAEGPTRAVLESAPVIEAYLGSATHD
jgi:ABC-type branched-subunit amino acid transport system ATPase component